MPGSQEMVAFNTREQNWFVNERIFKPEARRPHTCLYSSGFSFEKMLWCSCESISKLEICFKFWCFGEGDEYEWMSMRPAGGCWWPCWSGGFPSWTWSRWRQEGTCGEEPINNLTLYITIFSTYLFSKCIAPYPMSIMNLLLKPLWSRSWHRAPMNIARLWKVNPFFWWFYALLIMSALTMFEICTSRGLNTPGEFFSML